MAKLNPMARHAIARAYLAGARPSEIAADFNVSQAYVIAQAKWYEDRLQARREKTAKQKAREARTIAFPKRETRPAVAVERGRSALARELGILIVKNAETGISLPFVAFQHGKRFVLNRAA